LGVDRTIPEVTLGKDLDTVNQTSSKVSTGAEAPPIEEAIKVLKGLDKSRIETNPKNSQLCGVLYFLFLFGVLCGVLAGLISIYNQLGPARYTYIGTQDFAEAEHLFLSDPKLQEHLGRVRSQNR